MKIAMFDTHNFERDSFSKMNEKFQHEITFFEPRLNVQTAILASGFPCICCFVEDILDEKTFQVLSKNGLKLVALRSAGYNNVDLDAANRHGITVVRVPAYSPHSVAEYAVGLLLSLNRKIHKAYTRVREQNFSLEGMTGTTLFEKTVGVVGTGKIGSVFAQIMNGFGCKVIAHDPFPNKNLVAKDLVTYVTMEELLKRSDYVSLHVPLLPETKHIINSAALSLMKSGAVLINTGRGALIDSSALIDFLKSGHLAGVALDVYEEEEGIFFRDLSEKILKDDILVRLMAFPNVLLTSHQAFLTHEALTQIAEITLKNITDFELKNDSKNQVHVTTHTVEGPPWISVEQVKNLLNTEVH